MTGIRRGKAPSQLATVLEWYFEHRYGRTEGPGVRPFYCDPQRIGHLAVSEEALRKSAESATFKLFVVLAMYQALRDRVVMRRQRGLLRSDADAIGGLASLKRAVRLSTCACVEQGPRFPACCTVWKAVDRIDCHDHPGADCHVKHATRVFGRMADMGKLPTAAFHAIWGCDGGLQAVLERTCQAVDSPLQRAESMVAELSKVRRVGRKLATMYVSALSTPALAPEVSPWSSQVDGNALVVVDTNVARALDLLMPANANRTYGDCVAWIRNQSERLDLTRFRRDLPSYSPRLVQQALYSFCSKSNRMAQGDLCDSDRPPRRSCGDQLCPFHRGAQ